MVPWLKDAVICCRDRFTHRQNLAAVLQSTRETHLTANPREPQEGQVGKQETKDLGSLMGTIPHQ